MIMSAASQLDSCWCGHPLIARLLLSLTRVFQHEIDGYKRLGCEGAATPRGLPRILDHGLTLINGHLHPYLVMTLLGG